MSYQALYRKYRPNTFSDVVGQEHITETLKNELAEGKVVHAYLFTGTRGTGKTSCAKILAKAVNCLSPVNGDPCGECEMCRAISEGEITDIVEIDAASNNGVDSIRELREQVSFAPATGKYRVYIIDEVHMLSIGAFNALLKTLEEPPAHVVFILATTEVHKLPATILSRCQRFDFRRIEPEKICERINYIADKEGLTVTEDAASLIASAADGGMRDALSILDLCASSESAITEDTVTSVCAMAGGEYLLKLSSLIKNHDTEGALLLLDELHRSSVDMLRLLGELTAHYRDLMIIKTVKTGKKPIICSVSHLKALEAQAESYEITDIMAVLSVLQAAAANMQSGNRRCEMEMAIIKLCCPQVSRDASLLEKRISALEAAISGGAVIQRVSTPAEKTEPAAVKESNNEVLSTEHDNSYVEDDEIPLPEPPAEDNDYSAVSDTPKSDAAPIKTASGDAAPVERWDEILDILKKTCPLIAGVLQGSSAYISGAFLLIDAPNGQFKTMVNGSNPLYRDSIRKAAQSILGETYKLGPYRKAPEQSGDPLAQFAEKLKFLENN